MNGAKPGGTRRLVAAMALAGLLCANSAPTRQSIEDRIRAEGLNHSAAIEHADALTNGIGDRLTGSPRYHRAVAWTTNALKRIGLSNVHVEHQGPSLLSWHQERTWMRMVSPEAVMLNVIAAPWSASSNGIQRGPAIWTDIATEADFARFRGKLRGKIVLLGPIRATPQPTIALSHRIPVGGIPTEIAPLRQYFAARDRAFARMVATTRYKRALAAFLTAEGVAAVVVPSGETDAGGGTGLVTSDDRNSPVPAPWFRENRLPFPVFVTAIEDYGRIARNSRRGADLVMEYEAATVTDDADTDIENVVADIPGADPKVANEIVLAGAHLDSWIGGSGAIDNGAGVAITLEAVRILSTLGLKPRRTIRVVLYGGEEQGLLGSSGYARRHLGSVPRVNDADQRDIPVEGWRQAAGPPRLLSDHARLSVAFNVDGGSGRVRGIFTGGNPAFAEIVRSWIAPLADLGVDTVLDEPTWPADQTSFSDLGLPVIDVLQDPLDYDTRAHHTNMDTFERLSPDDLAQAATVVAILIWNAAEAPAMMPRTAQGSGHTS